MRWPSEQVLLQLLYIVSIPILSYAADVKQFSYAEMYACHVAINNAICLIFQFNRWESIRSLRTQFGYNDLYSTMICTMRRMVMYINNMCHPSFIQSRS